jgi:RimJ/RimL family protein N-acetyltransferase
MEPSYPIETERLLLRPFAESDLDALHAIHSRDDVARYLYLEPRDEAATRGMLAEKIGETRFDEEGSKLTVAATLRDDGRLVGELSLWWRSREHSQGEVGFVFHPDHGGSGLATEGAAAMLAYGFDGVGMHRIIGRCDARNDRSARLLERLGMRREAHLVENEWVKGEWTGELVYAILDREWAARD